MLLRFQVSLMQLHCWLSGSWCFAGTTYCSFTRPTTHTLYVYIRRPESSSNYSFFLPNAPQDGSVSTVTRLWTGNFGVRFLTEATTLSLLQNGQSGSGAHPALWVPEALPLGVKWPKREGNYCSADLVLSLMSRAVLLLPLCAIMASTAAVSPL